MSFYCYVESTSFSFKSSEAEQAFNRVLEECMDDYASCLDLDPHVEPGMFTLNMEGSDVGDSFPDRISNLVKAMGELVTGGFRVAIVTDSMSTDNDRDYYGGPSIEAITEFQDNYVINEVLSSLTPGQKAMLMQRLQAA